MIRKLLITVVAALIFHSTIFAQFGLTPAQRDSLNRLSKIDHDNMRGQLGITIPNRPGKSGTPGNPNFANNDESKVTPYKLPDPLVLKNGRKVITAKDWWEKRRPEIKEDFDRELYGRVPANVPSVTWQVTGIKDTLNGNYPIIEKTLRGVVDNSSYPGIKVEIELMLTIPKNASAAVPVVTHFGAHRSTSEPMTTIGAVAEPGWKHQLLQRGWGYAELSPESVQADNTAGLRSGIIGLVNKGAFRKPDDWGSLRAWAWGVGRAIDYYETDPSVDTKRLAIEGLSRYGKAAATTMMYETRLSLAFIGSAGAGGTKIYRRHLGQEIENLAIGENYWFAGNIIKYGSTLTVDDLPVDGHMLVALCAPRPIFISSGAPNIEGQWIDAKGMFLGGVYGGPVYKLLGKKDLGTTEFPPIGLPLVNGDIAFRQHAGGHTTAPNWSTWIAWACKYWGPCSYP